MQYSQTRYQDTLSVGISDTALSCTAASVAPTRTQGILTIGRLQSNTEDVYYTSVAGNVVTINLRGLSATALTPTTVVGNRKVHNSSESLEITTHHLYDANKARIDENEAITGSWTFSGTEIFANDLARSSTNAAPTTETAFTNKKYVNDQDALKVTKAGDTMSGTLDMGAQKVTTTYVPVAAADLTNKTYVDTQVSAIADVKVKVSAADTTTDYLTNKTAVGTHLTKTITNPAGDEDLTFATDAIQSSAGAASANKLMATDSNGFEDPTFVQTVFTAGEAIDGSVTPKAVFISPGTSASDTFPLQVQETENDTQVTITGVTWAAQTFRTGLFQTKITRVAINDRLSVSAGGTFTVDIRAVDGSSKPTGAALGSATFTPASVPSSYRYWNQFAIAIDVTPNTEYAIVVNLTASTILWSTGSGDTYTSGQPWTSGDSGGTWSSPGANDFTFRVWGYEAQTAGRVYQSDSDEPFRGAFDGFVTNNVAAAASATVKLAGVQSSFTGLTAGAIYYVSSTIGTITTTAGGLKVGRATSTTAIGIDKEGGFVVKSSLASPSLGQSTIRVEEYQNIFQFGFKPSYVQLDTRQSVVAGAGAAVARHFRGTYISNLVGFAISVSATGATADLVDLIDDASSIVDTEAGIGATCTLGTFLLTNTGLTFTTTCTDNSSVTANSTCRLIAYR